MAVAAVMKSSGSAEAAPARACGIGASVYGAAAIILGGVAIAFGDFVNVWQPVPATGAGRTLLAYVVGAVLIACGGAVIWRKGTAAAGATLSLLFFICGALWIPRVYNHVEIFGVWAGVCEQWATAMAGLVIFARSSDIAPELRERIVHIARVGFGLCAIAFGISHFSAVRETAKLVPAWLPPGQSFWAEFTGACHMLAGLAILTGVASLVGARLLTVMMAGFGLFVWLPTLIRTPTDLIAWGGNAVNLGLVAAAWVIADSIKAGPEAEPARAAARPA